MFKTLIKKVREESSNSSILTENDSEEINGNHDNLEHLKRRNSNHRRSNSNTHVLLDHHGVTSNPTEEKDRVLKQDLTNVVDNYAQILQSWIDAKEEIFQQKDDDIKKLLEQTNSLQNELTVLRNKLTELDSTRQKSTLETIVKTPYLQKQIDTLRLENENLKSTIKTLRIQLIDVEAERDDLLIKSTDISYSKNNNNNNDLENELKHLREIIIERDTIIEQQDKRLLIEHQTQAIQTDEDQSFVQVLAEPELETISKLQEELDDKNRTIKTLQERYNDLRKTLQREFNATLPRDFNPIGSTRTNNNHPSSHSNLPLIHYDESAASQSDIDISKRASTSRQMTATRKHAMQSTATSENSPAILPYTTVDLTKGQKNGQATLNNTNLRYLKHVIIKFMTSTEDEAIHLIRAVSTLLGFSSDEERLLRQTLEHKMSWFGKVTRLKPTSSSNMS